LEPSANYEKPSPPPSSSWFTKWRKKKGLYKIKTKPIAKVRVAAQDEEEEEWWN